MEVEREGLEEREDEDVETDVVEGADIRRFESSTDGEVEADIEDVELEREDLEKREVRDVETALVDVICVA